MDATLAQLTSQWSNPSDVTTVLMVIGADVVQKALAQTTGHLYTPVCFSFGWVAYSFMALVSVLGDGRLMPLPDYPVKVINLKSGYGRQNRSWVIGRLVRDLESRNERRDPMFQDGIRITIWEGLQNTNHYTRHSWSGLHWWGIATTTVQLIVSALPFILYREWGIFVITGVGNLLAVLMGMLPQWSAEKLPNRQHSDGVFALTAGNGSRDIVIIHGAGEGLDLEELCTQPSPRTVRPWEKFRMDPRAGRSTAYSNKWEAPARMERGRTASSRFHWSGARIRTTLGLPVGFWVTMIACTAQSVAWLLLIIFVAALTSNTWYLILVGAIGMFQNGCVAAVERGPEYRNLPLKLKDTIVRRKVMHALMDLEREYECGRPLLSEFFPGSLRRDEERWWNGDRKAYDEERWKGRQIPAALYSPKIKTLPASTVITGHPRTELEDVPEEHSSAERAERAVDPSLEAEKGNASKERAHEDGPMPTEGSRRTKSPPPTHPHSHDSASEGEIEKPSHTLLAKRSRRHLTGTPSPKSSAFPTALVGQDETDHEIGIPPDWME